MIHVTSEEANMKHAVIIAAFALLLSATPAAALGEIERTMAEEILRLSNAESSLATMREQVTKLVDTQVATMNLSDEEKTHVAERSKKMFDLIFEEMSWKKMKDQYIDLYVTVFTQEELAGLITFYRSPVGQSYLKKMPELMKRSMEVGQVTMERLGPRIQSMIEDMAEEKAPVDSGDSDPE
jgi:uncharacterized protein